MSKYTYQCAVYQELNHLLDKLEDDGLLDTAYTDADEILEKHELLYIWDDGEERSFKRRDKEHIERRILELTNELDTLKQML